MDPWLLVALGNPGTRYAATRHNIGWLAADVIARRAGAVWTEEKRWNAALAKSGGLLLLKPHTFMNLSGEAVQPAAAFYKIPPERILVLLDDVDLPFGTLRLRSSGSDGGHNGLKSISQSLGSNRYPRLRLGIGGARPAERAHPGQELADFVLSPFNQEELRRLPAFLEKAADCVECSLKSGVDAAMNRFNRKPSPPATPADAVARGNPGTPPGEPSQPEPNHIGQTLTATPAVMRPLRH